LTPTGKTLQILKYEDGTKKLWKIMDSAGTDITPKASMSTPTPKTPVNANSDQIEAIQKRLDAASTAFKSLKEEIDYLKTENAILRDKIDKLEKFIIPVI
jgi:chromosome segregation ATPase